MRSPVRDTDTEADTVGDPVDVDVFRTVTVPDVDAVGLLDSDIDLDDDVLDVADLEILGDTLDVVVDDDDFDIRPDRVRETVVVDDAV